MSENEKIEKTGADLEAAQAPAKPAKAADKKAAKAEKKDAKPGFFQRIARWFREMKSELKKVVGICIWVFDWLAGEIVRALLRLFGKV